MKVLGVFHGYLGGSKPLNAGAEHMAHALLSRLVADGHTVRVLVALIEQYAPIKDYTLDGVRVLAGLTTARGVLWWANRSHLVVTHLNATALALSQANRRAVPTVVLEHNNFTDHKALLTNYRPALAVFNSDWMRRDYEDTCDMRDTRSLVVHPPVFSEDYRALTGSHDRVTVVNLFHQKGGALFWRIAAATPEIPYLAVRGAYGHQIVPGDVPPNVEIVNCTSDMRGDVYSRSRLVLMPSEYESWGRVAVEAMASGIPVVASWTPGLHESLDYAGTFCDSHVEDWAKQVRRLWHDNDLYATMSRLSLQRSRELDDISRRQLADWSREVTNLPASRQARRTPRLRG